MQKRELNTKLETTPIPYEAMGKLKEILSNESSLYKAMAMAFAYGMTFKEKQCHNQKVDETVV